MNVTNVRVTDKHIAAGEPGNACNCALALAVAEALADDGAAVKNLHIGSPGLTDDAPYDGWRVSATLWEKGCTTRTYSAALGREAIDWIGAFDADAPVEPIEVELTWQVAS